MANDLETYLNNHLAGAAVGLLLATRLAESAMDGAEKLFFTDLKERISADQKKLTAVIELAGLSAGGFRNLAGRVLGKVGLWRTEIKSRSHTELGRFEMIEMLTIGIQGKSLLWQTLLEIAPTYPEWSGVNFKTLLKGANIQIAGMKLYHSREAHILFTKFGDTDSSH